MINKDINSCHESRDKVGNCTNISKQKIWSDFGMSWTIRAQCSTLANQKILKALCPYVKVWDSHWSINKSDHYCQKWDHNGSKNPQIKLLQYFLGFYGKFEIQYQGYKRRVILVQIVPKIATRCRLRNIQNQNWKLEFYVKKFSLK